MDTEERKALLFYRSYFEAIRLLPSKARLAAYDAVFAYGFDGEEPKVTDAAASVFLLIKPNLDASKRKAESGKRGGQARSKPQANGKQTASKAEAIKDKGLRIKDEGQGMKEEDPHSPLAAVMSAYMDKITPTPSQRSMDELKGYVETMGAECCLRAIDAALDAKAANWNYIRKILQVKASQGVRCIADWDRVEAERDRAGPKSEARSSFADVAERMKREGKL